jgi:hypothetical protein
MASVIIPVMLCFFLGPGAGQLYNKDYKKGAILIVTSLVILILSGVWYYQKLQPYIPNDLTTVDPTAMQQLLQNASGQLAAKDGKILAAFEALLTVIWLYGVVDAYRVAQNKRRV